MDAHGRVLRYHDVVGDTTCSMRKRVKLFILVSPGAEVEVEAEFLPLLAQE
jgi:hypothetical protein